MSKFNQPAFIAWCQVNLQGFKHDKDDRYFAKCPLHFDKTPSLRVFGNTAVFLCFSSRCAGSEKFKKWYYHQFCKETGLKPLPNHIFWKESAEYIRDNNNETIIASYIYTDRFGEALFRVDRFANKLFPISRYSAGLWLPGTGGAAVPLYHLNDLVNAQEQSLCLFVEGEKDADAARGLGFIATTKAGGAKISDLTFSLLEPLKRLKTVVIPDNDSVGKEYSLAVVSLLLQMEASAVMLPLPGIDDIPGGDLSDFIERERREGRNAAITLFNLISLLI